MPSLLPLPDGDRAPCLGFHLATVMFHRTRQLRNGSRPRVEAEDHKPLAIALLEMRAGAVAWQVHEPAPAPAVV